jgi:CheY-like chemotaxis protein
MLVLADVLDAAIAILSADFGTLQMVDPSGDLKIVAHRGFDPWWLDYWNSHATLAGACGAALKHREPVIVEDVGTSPIFAGTPSLEVQRRAGVRACVSLPLCAAGRIVGMISTHFRAPGRPPAAVLRALDPHLARAATHLHRLFAAPAGRILIVDGDADLREALREAFEDRGCAVIEASSGGQALHYLTSYAPAPSLVLADLSLPDMHGIELAAVIGVMGGGSGLQILLMTASRELAMTPGPPVLQKPVKAGEIDRFLEEVIVQLSAAKAAPAPEETTCGACGGKTPMLASPIGDGRQIFCRRCGGKAGNID